MKGELHASYEEPLVRWTFLNMDGTIELIDLLSGVATSRDNNGVKTMNM